MAVNQKRRQKRLMKRRRKDSVRSKEQAASVPYGLLSSKKKILTSRELPIYECLINPSWREDGLATILVSRRQPDSQIVCGVYMVDILCLGLKNTFCNADVSELEYKTKVRPRMNQNKEMVECSIPLAHHIVYGGIEFARQFGFEPHKDFKLSRHVLDDRDSIQPCAENVEFGKDGEPMFVAGPYDDAERIMRQLESKAGGGNFSFISGFDEDLFDEDV